MRIPFFVLLTLAACQQPAPHFDTDTVGLIKAAPEPIDVAPIAVVRTTAPPLAATASVSLKPLDKRHRNEVRSVTIGVDLVGAVAGELAIEFVAPDGTMYQRQAQTTGSDPWATQHFDFVLPVAGTWIDANDLSGTWDAHLFFGDSELLHETFDLMP